MNWLKRLFGKKQQLKEEQKRTSSNDNDLLSPANPLSPFWIGTGRDDNDSSSHSNYDSSSSNHSDSGFYDSGSSSSDLGSSYDSSSSSSSD
jgi:hypothetical protein